MRDREEGEGQGGRGGSERRRKEGRDEGKKRGVGTGVRQTGLWREREGWRRREGGVAGGEGKAKFGGWKH